MPLLLGYPRLCLGARSSTPDSVWISVASGRGITGSGPRNRLSRNSAGPPFWSSGRGRNYRRNQPFPPTTGLPAENPYHTYFGRHPAAPTDTDAHLLLSLLRGECQHARLAVKARMPLSMSGLDIEKMERETGFEPATSSLGNWHITVPTILTRL
jgi:hypothetical protein